MVHGPTQQDLKARPQMNIPFLLIIQARMNSSRFPGKMMSDVNGQPLLQRVIGQLNHEEFVGHIVVATTTELVDDAIEQLCYKLSVSCFRGSSINVLERFYHCALRYKSDTVIRVTGDCPFVSIDTVREVYNHYLTNQLVYACNTSPYTRPEGFDVEVFSMAALQEAFFNAVQPFDQEHVTPYIKRLAEPTSFFLHGESNLCNLRTSVDYPFDLTKTSLLYAKLQQTFGEEPYLYSHFNQLIESQTMPTDNQVINFGLYKSIYDSVTSQKAPALCIDQSIVLLNQSLSSIPGASQTYSKSYKHHIAGVSPVFLSKGKGASVIDVDGNQYVDLIQGLLPNIFGYAHDEINMAVSTGVSEGHSFSLATTVELELAQRLINIIPCAEMVRFGKNGSDATAAAIRVARAFTGKDRVAVCGYHGWQDWYIGSTSRYKGVPNCVRELTHSFQFNDIQSLYHLVSRYSGEFAAVILEPFNFEEPSQSFLSDLRSFCTEQNIVLIFDEICSGFHFGLGGVQKLFNISPDLATFGKALANGWPISVVTGRSHIMSLFEDVFFSFTFAGDTSAMHAALKVLDLLEHTNAYERINYFGKTLQDACTVFSCLARVDHLWFTKGRPPWSLFGFKDLNGDPCALLTALWIQEVTRRGVLVLTTFNSTAVWTQAELDTILLAFASAFKYVGDALQSGCDIESLLDGELPTPAFRARQ